MRPDHLSYRRLVKSALVGALIGVVFDLAVAFLTRSGSPFSLSQVPSYVAFGIVGFAGGWLFELFKAQTEVTDESVRALREVQRSVEQLTRRLTYWRHTGDVETYWMTVSEFRRAFPRRDLPRDIALYDRQLWVAYDEPTQTLSFDVVPPDDEVCLLFDDLREMIKRGQPELKRVARNAS